MTLTHRLSHYSRGIWPLVWPIMLSNLSVPLLGAVDTAILGHLDSARYLGAVAVGGSILTLIFWSFGFLRMGTTSLVSRAVGRADWDASVRLWLQSATLALGLAAVLLACHRWPLAWGIAWMDPEAATGALAVEYGQIRFLSAPATLLNYTLVGWFIGQQNTRRPLMMLLVTNGVNILLDWLLVLELGLNARGAAWASVAGEYTGLLLGLWLMRRTLKGLTLTQPWAELLRALTHLKAYAPLIQINRHLFVRTLCLLGVFTFFTAQGARLGTQVVAANAILLQFVMLTSHALDGYAHAAEALCGKAVGARERGEFARVVIGSGLWALATSALISGVFWLGQSLWLDFFTALPAVLAEANRQFGWVIALPLLGVWAYQLDGVFLGAGLTRAMQYAMIACVALVFAPLWWLTQPQGNTGLWLAFVAFNSARGLLMGAWLWHWRHRI